MRYVLGVDGGGSKTLAAVADETGAVLGAGRAGGSNHQGAGLAAALGQVRLAAESALQRAGTGPEVDAAYYALAGADFPEDFELLRPTLHDLGFAPRVGLNNDSMASLRAGTDNPNAVVVALGQGTVAAGRNAAGQEIRLPAVGWFSGDWGGGGDLVRDAVWYAARAHDGRGGPTMLQEMILAALGQPNMDELIRAIYFRRVLWEELRALAPLVFRAAQEGDAVARQLLIRQGEEVVATAVALLRRLAILHVPADVVLGGSIFRGEGPLLLDTVRQGLADKAPLARIVLLDTDPVIGTLFCAMDLLGLHVDEAVRERAKETYGALAESGAEVASR